MTKIITTALLDEVHYPIKKGFVENKLIARELSGNEEFNSDVSKSIPFRGAVADCLVGLVLSPNVSEGDISFSQTDKDNMLRIANAIYQSIGEPTVGEPKVFIEN